MKKLIGLLLLCTVGAFADVEQMMATVPNSTTVVTASTIYVQLILCSASSTTTLTITDTAGNMYFNAVPMTANQTTAVFVGGGPYNRTGIKMVGIKWSAGNANALVCQSAIMGGRTAWGRR